jgi:hypothetical protein
VERTLWCLSLTTAALAGVAAAVWLVSYWAEDEFSFNRVIGTVERPEETTFALRLALGRISVSHRLRAGSDALFALYARQCLGRGWFFRHPALDRPISPMPGGASRYLPRLAAGRSRSDADGPIEWRRTSVALPCWFLLLVLGAASFAGWSSGLVTGRAIGVALAAGLMLSLALQSLSARRGISTMDDAVRAIRDDKIRRAIAEGRLETGMTIEQVRQVLPGWNGRRTHYTIGRPNNVEMWEFRPDAPATTSPDDVIGVFFLNGALGVSTRHQSTVEAK